MENLSDNQRIEAVAGHIEEIIKLLGEDSQRQGLLKTPMRAAKALWFLTSGYRSDPSQLIKQALFDHEGSQMIVVRDIEFYSMCEHHILPFFGKVSIGYIPDGKIVGLSKLARIVNAYARRLQVQERFTSQLAEEIRKSIGAKGVIVVCAGEHLCMKMRGVEKQHSATVTTHYNGAFADSVELRTEFYNTLKQ